MLKLIITPLLVLIAFINVHAQLDKCNLQVAPILCKLEQSTIFFDTEVNYDTYTIDVFTSINGVLVPGLIENSTEGTADITFLQAGEAQVVVRYFDAGETVSICNSRVFVMDGNPINSLGVLSNSVPDQVACEQISLPISMFIQCPQCPFTWTVDGEVIELDQEVVINENFQIIDAQLDLSGVGIYQFCQQIFKEDFSCSTESCVQIDIVQITDAPTFSIQDEGVQQFCNGSTLKFINETIDDNNFNYKWTILYDTLEWNYYQKDLDFDFIFPGDYTISLQYSINNDPFCISPSTSQVVSISNNFILPISCDSELCTDDFTTYRSPINCESYTWTFDQNLGTLLSMDDSVIVIQWNDVTQYTETEVILDIEGCDEDICNQLRRTVKLFPSQLLLTGENAICDEGIFTYEADLIPDAIYLWEVNMLDSVSGIPPKIDKINNNSVDIEVLSFVGAYEVSVSAQIAHKECEVSSSFLVQRYNFTFENNICFGDLFRAELFPKVDEDVLWTLSNEDSSYVKQEIKSGLSNFIAFDYPSGGTYTINASIPSLDYTCSTGQEFTILEAPEVELLGPTLICPGDSYIYTLAGLGGNDIAEWTIFQNNSSIDTTGQTLEITWSENGGPYFIRVKRSTEVVPGQICESELFDIEIVPVSDSDIFITGEDLVCYDAIQNYTIPQEGLYIWSIDPPEIGTLITDDSTNMVTVQWHYSPNISMATLNAETSLCGESITLEMDIQFGPFQAIIDLPDTLCAGTYLDVLIENLDTFQTMQIYINDNLVEENEFSALHQFTLPGYNNVRFFVVKPNDCPGNIDTTIQIYVKEAPEAAFIYSMPFAQCPREDFEEVLVSISNQDSALYYSWSLDGNVVKEGYGSPELYDFLITPDMIDIFGQIALVVTNAEGCFNELGFPFDYDCVKLITPCLCKEDVIASIDTVIRHECSLISFRGSLDFSTVLSAVWRFPGPDGLVSIPILSQEDLIQDSILLREDLNVGDVALAVTCLGSVTCLETGEVTDSICDYVHESIDFDLFAPRIESIMTCRENLNYDVELTELLAPNSADPSTYNLEWKIEGNIYTSGNVILEDIVPEDSIIVNATMCTLDNSYCCTREIVIEVLPLFEANIVLPNGFCENEIWLFTLDNISSEIDSVIWDFGDGSGSTKLESEKGFLDSLEHTISVVAKNINGCIDTDTITVFSAANNIDGTIEFFSDECASTTALTYIENSESIIESYNWSLFTAPDSSTIFIDQSGSYAVTVTDINGCQASTTTSDILVSVSFTGNIVAREESCGRATAAINTNSNYNYIWYVNGDSVSTFNRIDIINAGTYDIKVVSIENGSGVICDSLEKTIIIHPNPDIPEITQEKVFCNPPINRLSVSNYEEVSWSIGLSTEFGNDFFTSQNGSYIASFTDENGCRSRSTSVINEREIDFEYLNDLCIQACREDIDSLNVSIPGTLQFFSSWSWITNDTFGIPYTVNSSNGFVTPLQVTDQMYDFVQLVVEEGECEISSPPVVLDIIVCNAVPPMEEPMEIVCDTIDQFSSNCGLTVYECLVSEINGGPKLYYEGSVDIPPGFGLCHPDTLDVSLSNGDIIITEFKTMLNDDGSLHIAYSANLLIADADDFEENNVHIRFDFCDENGENSYCLSYLLPWRSCNTGFDCRIQYKGLEASTKEEVLINYCLNLSEVIQDNCELTSYELEYTLWGDTESKMIFSETIEGPYEDLYCIQISIAEIDFMSGLYDCVEMKISGDCPGITCSDYQCNIFWSGGNIESIGKINENALSNRKPSHIEREVKKQVEEKNYLRIYPNPTYATLNIEIGDFIQGDIIKIFSATGKLIMRKDLDGQITQIEMTDYLPGIYQLSLIRNGKAIKYKKIVKIN